MHFCANFFATKVDSANFFSLTFRMYVKGYQLRIALEVDGCLKAAECGGVSSFLRLNLIAAAAVEAAAAAVEAEAAAVAAVCNYYF